MRHGKRVPPSVCDESGRHCALVKRETIIRFGQYPGVPPTLNADSPDRMIGEERRAECSSV
ncbi:hypothetical protein AOE01nite_26540 [Acetobacter oeni]|uniref:Uncharacterized protein n=1 Tax=Acetobacter oeni TaxID=304077 RepID=A0A511XNA6_9PROT|nr:hypothetical protein AOE01nite_26540 [Acetobacter oeni]